MLPVGQIWQVSPSSPYVAAGHGTHVLSTSFLLPALQDGEVSSSDPSVVAVILLKTNWSFPLISSCELFLWSGMFLNVKIWLHYKYKHGFWLSLACCVMVLAKVYVIKWSLFKNYLNSVTLEVWCNWLCEVESVARINWRVQSTVMLWLSTYINFNLFHGPDVIAWARYNCRDWYTSQYGVSVSQRLFTPCHLSRHPKVSSAD